MKTATLILALLTTALSAGTINIAVAANASYVVEELKKEFAKSHRETRIRVILGGSGKLAAQIQNGAPYGLFMSANMAYPEILYQQKLATTKPRIYAQGALAYFSQKERDFSKGMALLQENSIRKIAIGNPKTAPYGEAAVEAMKKAHVYTSVKKKLVYGESISQTLSYAVTAADIGIVATSSLSSPSLKGFEEHKHWECVDVALYAPIDQGVVLLKRGQDNPEYLEFYKFILSEQAKAIFKNYGYNVK